MKIITNGDGIGRPINPYQQFLLMPVFGGGSTSVGNVDWTIWNSEHPQLPVIDHNGVIITASGEFEVTKVWQIKSALPGSWVRAHQGIVDYFGNDFEGASYILGDIRQVYQIEAQNVPITNDNDNPHPGQYIKDVNGKEHFFADGELAEIKAKLMAKVNSTESPREVLTQAAEQYGNSFRNNFGHSIPEHRRDGFKDGVMWQASQPNLISRESVTEILEALAELFEERLSDYNLEGDEMSRAEENAAEILKKYRHIYNPIHD